MLDDGKHVIGVSGRDAKKLFLENVENGSKVEFGESHLFGFYISTLIFDEDTGSLYVGDTCGELVQYKVNTANLICKIVKYYEDLGIGAIRSSHRFMHFLFFGGTMNKIRVLGMSTGKLLPGHIDTSIRNIRSLQLCVKNPKEIYLTVSSNIHDYSDDKTDIFDLSHFIKDDPDIFQKFLTKYSMNQNSSEEKSTKNLKTETIKNVTQERDSYKTKLIEMTSKYDDLKKNYNELRNKNKDIKKAYKLLKMEFDRKYDQITRKMNLVYQHRSNKTTTDNKMPQIRSGLFDQTDPLVIIRDLK